MAPRLYAVSQDLGIYLSGTNAHSRVDTSGAHKSTPEMFDPVDVGILKTVLVERLD